MASASGSGIITPANASENEGPSTPPSFAQSLGKQIVSGLARLSGWGRKRVRRVQFQPLAEVHEFERYPCGGGGVPDADQIALGLGRCVGHSSAPLVTAATRTSTARSATSGRTTASRCSSSGRRRAAARLRADRGGGGPRADAAAGRARPLRQLGARPALDADERGRGGADRLARRRRRPQLAPRRRSNSVRGAVAALVAGAAGRSARIRRAMAQSAAEAAAAAAARSARRAAPATSSGSQGRQGPFAFPAGSPSPRAKPAPPSGKRKAARLALQAKGSPSKAKLLRPTRAEQGLAVAIAVAAQGGARSAGETPRGEARRRGGPPMVASPSPRKSPPKRGSLSSALGRPPGIVQCARGSVRVLNLYFARPHSAKRTNRSGSRSVLSQAPPFPHLLELVRPTFDDLLLRPTVEDGLLRLRRRRVGGRRLLLCQLLRGASSARGPRRRARLVHRSFTAGECFLRNASSDLRESAPLCRRSVQSGLAAQTKAATPLKSAASPPNLAESKLFSVGEKRATTTPSTPPSPRTRAVRASTDATAEVGAASAGRWKTTRVSRSPPKTPSETSAVTYSCTAPGFQSSSGAIRPASARRARTLHAALGRTALDLADGGIERVAPHSERHLVIDAAR